MRGFFNNETDDGYEFQENFQLASIFFFFVPFFFFFLFFLYMETKWCKQERDEYVNKKNSHTRKKNNSGRTVRTRVLLRRDADES